MTQQSTEDLYVTLVRFLVQAKHEIITAGAQYGLTMAQALTLFLAVSDEPQSMNAISACMGCDASNATGLVDGLEQKGLLAREEKPGDRRTKMVHLLPEGKAVRQAIIQELTAHAQLTKKLSATEVAQLTTTLRKASASS